MENVSRSMVKVSTEKDVLFQRLIFMLEQIDQLVIIASYGEVD